MNVTLMEKIQADQNYKLNLLSIWIWSIIILVVSPLNIHTIPSVEVIDHPNVVSLISEDSSGHFMDYYPGGVKTPDIEPIDGIGITFGRAFSNSPVCSVAGTTVINGLYASRTVTHHHRSIESVKMPTVKKSTEFSRNNFPVKFDHLMKL